MSELAHGKFPARGLICARQLNVIGRRSSAMGSAMGWEKNHSLVGEMYGN